MPEYVFSRENEKWWSAQWDRLYNDKDLHDYHSISKAVMDELRAEVERLRENRRRFRLEMIGYAEHEDDCPTQGLGMTFRPDD